MIFDKPIDRNSLGVFFELPQLEEDRPLLDCVRACFEEQKVAGEAYLKSAYQPSPRSHYETSKEALDVLLESGVDLSDIGVDRSLSNCIVFNFGHVRDAVFDNRVADLRARVDERIQEKIRVIFQEGDRLNVNNSGHFWYPPGSYMGWHTNLRGPAWRMYVSYAEEPGKSFFRYRDPHSGAIITVMDRGWNFRLFRITPQWPFWHAIYSDTNRFSVGYKIYEPPSFTARLGRKVSGIMKAAFGR
jgi:hypothetical protein